MYPYPWSPPPMMPQNGIDPQTLQQAIKIAERLQNRDAREKERAEKMKHKKREEEEKAAAARRARTLSSLEIYILGIISYPLWAPLYSLAVQHLQTVVK